MTLGHVVDRKMREMGYIRKPAVENLKNRRALRDRVAAEGAPEVRHCSADVFREALHLIERPTILRRGESFISPHTVEAPPLQPLIATPNCNP